jgi:dTDP-4-dehydrorhamnose 3,5-epimerase
MSSVYAISSLTCADDHTSYLCDANGKRISPGYLESPDVRLIRTNRIFDARGYFCVAFQQSACASNDFSQDNQSRSDRAGTVRGPHFQRPPFAQAKLVRVLHGSIFDVAVDLRRWSPSYGRHIAAELGSDGDEQLLVPAGFAHGFCTLEPDTLALYKVDQVSAAHDGRINWADPGLGTGPLPRQRRFCRTRIADCRSWSDLSSVFE